MSAEQIVGLILGGIKMIVESHFGRELPGLKAMITVPPSFNSIQREALKDSATIAGLECQHLISRSAAAVCAARFHQQEDQSRERKVIVFDFGSDCLNVSLLYANDVTIAEKSTFKGSKMGW